MTRSGITLLRVATMTLVAMCSVGTSLLAAECPPSIPATPAALDPAIDPDGPWIGSQCPEACDDELDGKPDRTVGAFKRWVRDANDLDWIYVECPQGTTKKYDANGGKVNAGEVLYEVGIPSSNTCWNCVEGCAGPAGCPDGETCRPTPLQPGSDCRRWVCNDPNYALLVETQANGGTPNCNRTTPCLDDWEPHTQQCVPAEVWLDGPTYIPTGASCEWTADALSECSPFGYQYSWYVGNQYVGSGRSYSGRRPATVPAGTSWPIRVDATYNGHAAGSREIYVRESAHAPVCTAN